MSLSSVQYRIKISKGLCGYATCKAKAEKGLTKCRYHLDRACESVKAHAHRVTKERRLKIEEGICLSRNCTWKVRPDSRHCWMHWERLFK